MKVSSIYLRRDNDNPESRKSRIEKHVLCLMPKRYETSFLIGRRLANRSRGALSVPCLRSWSSVALKAPCEKERTSYLFFFYDQKARIAKQFSVNKLFTLCIFVKVSNVSCINVFRCGVIH